MWKPILAISLGAVIGALLRWQLGLKLNSLFPSLPPGTLTANLIGAATSSALPSPISPKLRTSLQNGAC